MGVEFVVEGTPKSLQAKPTGRNRWKAEVTKAATAATDLEIEVGDCQLRVYFFFDGKTDLDVDNIVKPISDALNAVAYPDDAGVIDVRASKRDLNNLETLNGAPGSVFRALSTGKDFVFIQVAPANQPLEF